MKTSLAHSQFNTTFSGKFKAHENTYENNEKKEDLDHKDVGVLNEAARYLRKTTL